MLLLLCLGIYFLMLVFWCFKNLCLSFTFNFPPHFVLTVLKTACFSCLSRTVFTVRRGKYPYAHKIMIPLDMFCFMTGRSDWLNFLFRKSFWFVLHILDVSPLGSSISICLACHACCRQRCPILCSFHQQLGNRKQAPDQRTFLELAWGKLKQQLGFCS